MKKKKKKSPCLLANTDLFNFLVAAISTTRKMLYQLQDFNLYVPIIWRPKERSAYTFLNFTFLIQRKVSHHNIPSFRNKLQENQILKFFCLKKKKKNLSTISQPHSLPFLKNSQFQRNHGIFWSLFHSIFV